MRRRKLCDRNGDCPVTSCDPSGVEFQIAQHLTGGIASLNPRLMAGTPAGVLRNRRTSCNFILSNFKHLTRGLTPPARRRQRSFCSKTIRVARVRFRADDETSFADGGGRRERPPIEVFEAPHFLPV